MASGSNLTTALVSVPIPAASGYIEMNAPVSEAAGSRADDAERVALISTLYRLGYDGVVWNCVVSSRATVLPPVAVPASFFMGAGGEGEGPVMTSGHSVLRLTNLRQLEHRRFQQYSRITYHNLTPGEAASFNTISNNQKFDVVAIEPNDTNSFLLACTHMNVDIIVLNLSDRLPYRLTPTLMKAAVSRGVCFEVTYASSLGDDATARRLLFSNIAVIVRFTKGKSLLISSGASSALRLRSPHDVINLAAILGLAADHAKAVVAHNPLVALAHSASRRGHNQSVVISEI